MVACLIAWSDKVPHRGKVITLGGRQGGPAARGLQAEIEPGNQPAGPGARYIYRDMLDEAAVFLAERLTSNL